MEKDGGGGAMHSDERDVRQRLIGKIKREGEEEMRARSTKGEANRRGRVGKGRKRRFKYPIKRVNFSKVPKLTRIFKISLKAYPLHNLVPKISI